MRVRFMSVSYQFGGNSSSLERHFREMREAMNGAAQSYPYLRTHSAWRPPMDIHETAHAFLVKIEVAGAREESIEVALYPNALVVSGERVDDVEHDDEMCFHAAQVRYGPFRVDISLPTAIRQEDVTAGYDNGFLRVRLPKVTAEPPRGVRESPKVAGERQDGSRWQAHGLQGLGAKGGA